MATMTRKEAVLMQQQIDTLKKINLAMCINIHSSKLTYPKKFKLPEFLSTFLSKYIVWRAKRDFNAVTFRIKDMQSLLDYNTKNDLIEG